MFKIKNKKLLVPLVLIPVMLLFLWFDLTLNITGLIAGEQETIRIGLLLSENNPYYLPINDNSVDGIMQSLSDHSSIYDRFRFELITRYDGDLNSSINDFIDSGANVIKVISSGKVFEILNMTDENKILLFSQSGGFPFLDTGNYTFFLRDRFITPTLVLADYVNYLNIERVGVIYMKTPFKWINNETLKDDTTDMFSLTHTGMGGEVLFESTYYVENKSNETEILSLIESTEPEAVVFLGWGTKYREILDLILKIRDYNNTIKIFSLEWPSDFFTVGNETTNYGFPVPTNYGLPYYLENVVTVKEDYLPEKLLGENGREYPLHVKSPNPSLFVHPFVSARINYPHYIEGYIYIQLLKNLVETCGDDTDCMQERLHEDTFDTDLGKVKFTKNGVIIRPKIITQVFGGKVFEIKRYTTEDIINIAKDYNLDFFE